MAQWLGYVFCEFSFRWFDTFDVPCHEDDWGWRHHVIFFVGQKPYSLGCYFYNIGGNHESR